MCSEVSGKLVEIRVYEPKDGFLVLRHVGPDRKDFFLWIWFCFSFH